MVTRFDYLVETERRKDEMMRAEQYHLAAQLQKRNSLLTRVSRPLLARLGELLVVWGSRLQIRATIHNGIGACTDQRHTSLAQ